MELSKEEAAVLSLILDNVGGNQGNSLRVVADNISKALGIKIGDFGMDLYDKTRAIFFKENTIHYLDKLVEFKELNNEKI